MVLKNVKLIEDWKQAWRFASIQFSTIGIVLMIVAEAISQSWFIIPDNIKEQIPHSSSIAIVLFVLTCLGRIFRKDRDE